MQAYADVLLRTSEPAGEAHWRRPLARSLHDRRGAASGRRAVGQRAAPVFERDVTGSESVVLASVWLAFFIIATGHVVAFGY